MAFPQQTYPQIVHLFVNQFNGLLGSGSTAINTFYQLVDKHKINFLSLYDLQSVLPGNSSNLANFINLGKTNHGILDFSGSIDLFNASSNGLSRYNLINTYNTNNPNNKINWITLENEFWNLSSQSNTSYSNCCNINVNSSTVTLSNGITTASPYFTVGNSIDIGGYQFQIISIVNSTTFTIDRPIDVTILNQSCTIYNVASIGMLNFETFLNRVKNLRTYTYPSGVKIEAYLARKIPANQWNLLVPHIDRVLIENDYDISNYSLYNDTNSNKNRTVLLNCSQNRYGTITIAVGTNTIYGSGTLFTYDLGLGTKIVANGNIFTINSIISDTQATIVGNSNVTLTNGTFRTYFDFAPIHYVNDNKPLRRSWLTTPSNSKSFIDIYKLYTEVNYSVAGSVQTGSSPICYNAETSSNITGSTNLVGISIFSRTGIEETDLPTSLIKSGTTVPTTFFGLLITATDTTSNPASNGTITTNFNSANLTPPYIYTYTKGNVTYTSTSSTLPFVKSGLTSGSWYVTVKDSSIPSFTSTTSVVTIAESFQPTVQVGSNNATFTLSGGVPTYTILSVDGNGVYDGRFSASSLTDGTYTYSFTSSTYTFLITDSNLGSRTIVRTINSTSGPTIGLINSTNPTCAAAENGLITVSLNGGTPPYTVYYNGPSGSIIHSNVNSTTDSYTNGVAGIWSIYSEDVFGLTSNTISLTFNYTFFASINTSVPGLACFTITGGTTPYLISSNSVNPGFITSINNNGTSCFNLLSGSYLFNITDASGCTTNISTSLQKPLNLLLSVISITDPSCALASDGSIVVGATNGTAPYTYSISGPTTLPNNGTGIFNGLGPGTYTVTVTDGTNRSTSLIITLNSQFKVDTYLDPNDPNGQTICISATGGTTGQYLVTINGIPQIYNTASTVNCYTGICKNNTIFVTDGNCQRTTSIFITCPITIETEVTPVSCRGRLDGSVNIKTSGGTPNYNFTISSITTTSYVNINNSTGNVTSNNLIVGTYVATVTDNSVPPQSAQTIFNVPLDFSFTTNSNFLLNTIYVDLLTGNHPPFIFDLKRTTQLGYVIDQTITANTMGTYAFNVVPGNSYVISGKDNTNCIISSRVFNVPASVLPIEVDVLSITNPSCQGATDGSITFEGLYGYTPYISYSATNGVVTYTSTTSGLFTNLEEGVWTLYVEDQLNYIATDTVTLVSTPFTAITSIIYSSSSISIIVPTNNLSPSSYNVIIQGINTYTIPTENVEYLFPFTGCGTVDIALCNIPSSFRILYNFVPTGGTTPNNAIIRGIDGLLYGITFNGGNGYGTIYSYNEYTDTYNVIYSFNGYDGKNPTSIIQDASGVFYGTASDDGTVGYGVGLVFSCDTLGNYGVLHYFDGNYGISPISLVKTNSNLYGITLADYGVIPGSYAYGTIFYIDSIGTFNHLYFFRDFNSIIDGDPYYDGSYPQKLYFGQTSGYLYGITQTGGWNSSGAIFYIDTLNNTYNFLTSIDIVSYPTDIVEDLGGSLIVLTPNTGNGAIGTYPPFPNNTGTLIYNFNGTIDGSSPVKFTKSMDDILYGTTTYGGANGFGTIYSSDTIGNLYAFYDFVDYSPYAYCSIIREDGDIIYGTVNSASGYGSIFKYAPSGQICCYNTSVNVIPTINFTLSSYILTGSPVLCLSIITGTSMPGPYTLIVDSIPYSYDENLLENCYLFNTLSCGDSINYSICTQYSGVSGCCISGTYSFSQEFQITSSLVYSGGSQGTISISVIANTQIPHSLTILGQDFTILDENRPYQFTFDGITSCTQTIDYLVCGVQDPIGLVYSFGTQGISDGAYPLGDMVYASDGLFYGTNTDKGNNSNGVIFSFDPITNLVNPVSNIHSIIDSVGPLVEGNPFVLYGCSQSGGRGFGTLFEYNIGGSLADVYQFSGTSFNDGESPRPLILSVDGYMYGVTTFGGAGRGTLFKYSSGFGYSKVYNFGVSDNAHFPTGFLLEASDGHLYGKTKSDAVSGNGTLFRFNKTTNNLTILKYFSSNDGVTGDYGAVIEVNNILYGLNATKGQYSGGTMFSYNLTTSAFTILHHFNPNIEGYYPNGGLVLSNDGLLYGLTTGDGLNSFGGIFSYNISAHTLTFRRNFIRQRYPNLPYGSLVEYNNVLYGLSYSGGDGDFGTIFKFTNDILTTCCVEDQFNLSGSLDITYSGIWNSGRKVCVEIDSITSSLIPPYFVTIENQTYPYNTTNVSNCYSVTGCNNVDVYVTNLPPSNKIVNLYDFGSSPNDGTYPYRNNLLQLGGQIYGVTFTDNGSNTGLIFKYEIQNNNYRALTNFNTPPDLFTPIGGLSDGGYGVASNGGQFNAGGIFNFDFTTNINTVTHGDFNPATTGFNPQGGLLQINDKFYCTTTQGGSNNGGNLVEYNDISNTFNILHSFPDPLIAQDGLEPWSEVILGSDGLLYGTTKGGGANGYGVLYSYDLGGGGYTKLVDFDTSTECVAGLVEVNGILFGLDRTYGLGYGSIFSYEIAVGPSSFYYAYPFDYTNGANPENTMILCQDGKVYGTTPYGGNYNGGTLFNFEPTNPYIINTLYHFGGIVGEGINPTGKLIQADNGLLYGMTQNGGLNNQGMLYTFSITDGFCSFSGSPLVPCIEPFTAYTVSVTTGCTLSSSTVALNIYGGTLNYLIEATNGITNISATTSVQGIYTLNNLDPSIWTVSVTDDNGTGTTISYTYYLSKINLNTTIDSINSNICVTYTGNTTPYSFYVDNNLISTTNVGGINTVCVSAICNTNHVLKVTDGNGCIYLESFLIPCANINLTLQSLTNPFCQNSNSIVNLKASGGTPTYHYSILDLIDGLTYTADSITNVNINVPANGHSYQAFVTDLLGSVQNNLITFTTSATSYGDISTLGNNVLFTYSGASGVNIYNNNVLLYTNNSLPINGGTYQYLISCGTNNNMSMVTTNGVQTCTYTANTFVPCDLSATYTVTQPICQGGTASNIGVSIVGGFANYIITLTNQNNPLLTYSANTSLTYWNFNSTQYPTINLIEGIWDLTIIDSGSPQDTYTTAITITHTFDVYVSNLNNNSFCLTMSGGSQTPYNVVMDGIQITSTTGNFGSTFLDNVTYCFNVNCGNHNLVITNPFASQQNQCTINLPITVPCFQLSGTTTYVNPPCDLINNGTISVSVTGGSVPYIYRLTNSSNIITQSFTGNLPTHVFNILNSDTYLVSVSSFDGGLYQTYVTLDGTFYATAPLTSSTFNTITIEISGGSAPYNIYLDNTIALSGATSAGTYSISASCGNHTWEVVDASAPRTYIVNQPIFNNTSFSGTSDWLTNIDGGSCSGFGANINIGGGLFTFTSTTSTVLPGGCIQAFGLGQNYIFQYGTPISVTYAWSLTTGIVNNYVYISPYLVTPFGTQYISSINNFAWIPNHTYNGTLTLNSTTFPAIYSGYSFYFLNSMSYNNTVGTVQFSSAQLTLLSYVTGYYCSITGTTYVPCANQLYLNLISQNNPTCDIASNGQIIISASSGTPPYTYSATNGTLSYTNNDGIFNNLSAGNWYVSVSDQYLTAYLTGTTYVTLINTFYANIQTNVNSVCVTVSGGTQPYTVIIDGVSYSYNTALPQNCYNIICNHNTIIDIIDSSGN